MFTASKFPLYRQHDAMQCGVTCLSTVRHAGCIMVMDQGRIVERGTHEELVEKRGCYYRLVKNQIEL